MIIKPPALQQGPIMGNQDKQAKPDYLYQCQTCNTQAHETEPSNVPCPICEKRMELRAWTMPNPDLNTKTITGVNEWPCQTPEPIKYPEEIKTNHTAQLLSNLERIKRRADRRRKQISHHYSKQDPDIPHKMDNKYPHYMQPINGRWC